MSFRLCHTNETVSRARRLAPYFKSDTRQQNPGLEPPSFLELLMISFVSIELHIMTAARQLE